MLIFFQEILMQLFLWLLKLIDGIMEIFSAIAGIADVTYQGRQVNILDLLISNSSVGTVFWCVLILAVGLTCIFAIVGLIKNMIANNRQVSGIMGKFFLALLGTLAMLIVVILGVLISNALLKLVSEVFQLGGDTKLSTALFNACVGDWKKGHSIAEFNTNVSVGKIFGSYSTTLGIWPKDWKQNGMINPDTFMYLPAMIAAIGLVIALIVACVNLAKRIYEIVLLYLVMPVSMSTLPMDDGARFKIWRETFVTKIILAYGTVFSVNLFILLLPIISQIKITGAGGFANSIFYIFMLVGGAIVIPAGQNMFAKLFGTAEDSHSGHGFLRGAFYGSRMVGGAAVGAFVGAAKGGAKLGKKALGGHGKKEDSEKFSEDKKGSGSSDDSGGGGDSVGSEKFDDNKPATENSSGNTTSGNTDSQTTAGNADDKSTTESSDSTTSGNTDNKSTAEGSNNSVILNNAGNGKVSANQSTSDSADKLTIEGSNNNTISGNTDSDKFSDSKTVSSNTDSKNTSGKTDSQTSSGDIGGQSATVNASDSVPSGNTDNGKFSDSQTISSNTDNKATSGKTDSQTSSGGIGGQSATVNASDSVSGNTDNGKFSDSQIVSSNTDSKDTSETADNQTISGIDNQATAVNTSDNVSGNTDSGKFSDSQTTSSNTDRQTTSGNADNQTAAVNTSDNISGNTDSGKFSDSQTVSSNADSQVETVNSSEAITKENTDSGKFTDSQSATDNSNNKETAVSTDSKTSSERTDIKTTSENASNGKPTNNQVTMVNTDGKAQTGNVKTAEGEKYSDSNVQSVNTDNDETAGGKIE